MKLTANRITQAAKLGDKPKMNRKQTRFYRKTLTLQIAKDIRKEVTNG